MLRGSMSGEPRYASILWADDQGISSEIFKSLSFFIRSRGARGVDSPVPARGTSREVMTRHPNQNPDHREVSREGVFLRDGGKGQERPCGIQ